MVRDVIKSLVSLHWYILIAVCQVKPSDWPEEAQEKEGQCSDDKYQNAVQQVATLFTCLAAVVKTKSEDATEAQSDQEVNGS